METLRKKDNTHNLNILTSFMLFMSVQIWAAVHTTEKFCFTEKLKNANTLVA
jgi:hypothetical protein